VKCFTEVDEEVGEHEEVDHDDGGDENAAHDVLGQHAQEQVDHGRRARQQHQQGLVGHEVGGPWAVPHHGVGHGAEEQRGHGAEQQQVEEHLTQGGKEGYLKGWREGEERLCLYMYGGMRRGEERYLGDEVGGRGVEAVAVLVDVQAALQPEQLHHRHTGTQTHVSGRKPYNTRPLTSTQ
jgi:hypothetical protein